jgi:hypothetical protein
MRIYLISPTHYRPDGLLVKSDHYWTSALTLPYQDYGNMVVRPTDMQPEIMLEGFTKLYQRFYS